MTRSISLIITIVGGTLALVPAAWGMFPEVVEGTAPTAPSVYVDAPGRALPAATPAVVHSDSFQRVDLGGGVTRPTVLVDSHDRTTPVGSTTATSATSSGTEIEWSQIGAGFGLGILLALGLALMVRASRIRPVAH
jgi:hypothetical protein